MLGPVPIFAYFLFAGICYPSSVSGQVTAASQERRSQTARFVYKQKPRRTMTVFYPEDWQAKDQRAALVIFRCNIPLSVNTFADVGW